MEMEVIYAGNKKVEAHWRGFTVMADQPKDYGGDDTAPTPFDYLLISLGTCTAFYILAYCQNKNIPTDKIRIIQREQRNPETHMVSEISFEIQVPADFPEQSRNTLIKVAESCAVKKQILNPPDFVTNVVVK